jgi:hypothetical protein
MPWHVRIARYINRQASAPRGAFGRFLDAHIAARDDHAR